MRANLGALFAACTMLAGCGGGGGSASPQTFSSLTGTWFAPSHCVTGCELNVFFPDGTGVFGLYWPDHPTDPGKGVQRFTYSWDSTQHFSVTGVLMDTTGDWNDFQDAPPSNTAWVPTGANSATVGDHAMVRLTRSAASALEGTWYTVNPSTGTWRIAVFLDDGRYALMREGAAAGGGQTGIEFGTYTWASTTGALAVTVAPAANTLGAWGFSQASSVTIAVNGDVATITADSQAPVTATRLEP